MRGVRRQARELGVPWICDPLLFKTALPGYTTARHLQGLDYAPGRDERPYSAADFADPGVPRWIGRNVVGVQYDIGASAVCTGGFVLQGLPDPWLPISTALHRAGIDAAAAFGRLPTIASVSVRMRDFMDPEHQIALARSYSARRPDFFLLMLDGVHADSSPKRIVAAIRLALILQRLGAPVVVARSGELRRLFHAFGVWGVEAGLGRLLRFAVSDYDSSGGGPGPSHARFEVPALGMALRPEEALAVLGSGRVPPCQCPACLRVSDPQDQVAAGSEHDAHVAAGLTKAWKNTASTQRVAMLETELRRQVKLCATLREDGVDLLDGGRPERWLRALVEGVQQGLLVPDRLTGQAPLPVERAVGEGGT